MEDICPDSASTVGTIVFRFPSGSSAEHSAKQRNSGSPSQLLTLPKHLTKGRSRRWRRSLLARPESNPTSVSLANPLLSSESPSYWTGSPERSPAVTAAAKRDVLAPLRTNQLAKPEGSPASAAASLSSKFFGAVASVHKIKAVVDIVPSDEDVGAQVDLHAEQGPEQMCVDERTASKEPNASLDVDEGYSEVLSSSQVCNPSISPGFVREGSATVTITEDAVGLPPPALESVAPVSSPQATQGSSDDDRRPPNKRRRVEGDGDSELSSPDRECKRSKSPPPKHVAPPSELPRGPRDGSVSDSIDVFSSDPTTPRVASRRASLKAPKTDVKMEEEDAALKDATQAVVAGWRARYLNTSSKVPFLLLLLFLPDEKPKTEGAFSFF
jgi:hypothetical protein